MSEKTEVKSAKIPAQGDSFRLSSALESIEEQAARHGVLVAYDTHTPSGERLSHLEEAAFSAGNMGKVSLAALCVRDTIDPNQRVRLSSSDMRPGSGFLDELNMKRKKLRYDQIQNGVPVFRLFEDMLLRSSNTAYKVLTRVYADRHGSQAERADIINEEYKRAGWKNTRVEGVADAVEIGTTSAADVLDQFRFLNTAADGAEQGSLAEVAWNTLGHSMDSGMGVRSFDLAPGTDVVNISSVRGVETGAQRHESGLVILPRTEGGEDSALQYAFMINIEGRGHLASAKANYFYDRMSGEIARQAGARVPRYLGLRALLN
jgi:hypothetical protein